MRQAVRPVGELGRPVVAVGGAAGRLGLPYQDVSGEVDAALELTIPAGPASHRIGSCGEPIRG